MMNKQAKILELNDKLKCFKYLLDQLLIEGWENAEGE